MEFSEELFRPVSADSKMTWSSQMLRTRSLIDVVAVDGHLTAVADVGAEGCCAALHFHLGAMHDLVMT